MRDLGTGQALGKRRKLLLQSPLDVRELSLVHRLGGKKYLNPGRGMRNVIANPKNLHWVLEVLKGRPRESPLSRSYLT